MWVEKEGATVKVTIDPDQLFWVSSVTGKEHCLKDECLSLLLAEEGLLFVGTPKTCFFEDQAGQAALWINCNDTFGYGCADAEPLLHSEIGPVTKLYLQWGCHGVIKWVALRRKERPIPEIVEHMKKDGHWDAELEAIPSRWQ